MGLFGKIKNIFYDIEEVEVPAEIEKKENKEIKEVKINPIIEEDASERELFKSKNTFNFPIFDNEEEEIKPAQKKEVQVPITTYEAPKREIRRENNYNITPSVNTNKERERKVFTPTPVISPVYGILDKNYKKEEVIQKKEVYVQKESDKSYDYVRNKAYGTLEDELENTLTRINQQETVQSITQDISKTIEKIDESGKNIEDLLTEIESTKLTVGDLEENMKDKIEKEEFDTKLDNTLEHDLFNLIDSMYENKEE